MNNQDNQKNEKNKLLPYLFESFDNQKELEEKVRKIAEQIDEETLCEIIRKLYGRKIQTFYHRLLGSTREQSDRLLIYYWRQFPEKRDHFKYTSVYYWYGMSDRINLDSTREQSARLLIYCWRQSSEQAIALIWILQGNRAIAPSTASVVREVHFFVRKETIGGDAINDRVPRS